MLYVIDEGIIITDNTVKVPLPRMMKGVYRIKTLTDSGSSSESMSNITVTNATLLNSENKSLAATEQDFINILFDTATSITAAYLKNISTGTETGIQGLPTSVSTLIVLNRPAIEQGEYTLYITTGSGSVLTVPGIITLTVPSVYPLMTTPSGTYSRSINTSVMQNQAYIYFISNLTTTGARVPYKISLTFTSNYLYNTWGLMMAGHSDLWNEGLMTMSGVFIDSFRWPALGSVAKAPSLWISKGGKCVSSNTSGSGLKAAGTTSSFKNGDTLTIKEYNHGAIEYFINTTQATGFTLPSNFKTSTTRALYLFVVGEATASLTTGFNLVPSPI